MRYVWIIVGLTLGACAPFVPVADLDEVPASQKQESLRIRVYTVGSENYPEIERHLAPVTAYSCKFLMTDPPASKGEALSRLRLEASKLNADGIIDVTFDTRGADAWGTNCWESVQASGTAVRFKHQ